MIWDQLHNTFGAETAARTCSARSSKSRRETMIAANQWPKDKPLPDPEQFAGARDCWIRR